MSDVDELAAIALVEHLEAARQRRDITRGDLAYLAGLSPAAVERIFTRGRAQLHSVLAIARVLGFELQAVEPAHSVEDIVDDVAVERAVQGERVALTRLEQAAAVKVMQRRGRSARETAEVLRVDQRWVNRVRAGRVKYAREVA